MWNDYILLAHSFLLSEYAVQPSSCWFVLVSLLCVAGPTFGLGGPNTFFLHSLAILGDTAVICHHKLVYV